MTDRADAGNDDRPTLKARLFVLLQHLLHQHALSASMRRAAGIEAGRLTTLAIRTFARAYRIDLAEARAPKADAYPSFNAFFTRALRPEARPLPEAPSAIASPVDGTVSAVGGIDDGRLFQAKGRDYALDALLGGDPALARPFRGGLFATLYLSPRDYHRVHMPIAGHPTLTLHIPGRLFSVNPTTVAGVPGLFARNERAVCLFETAVGPMALILVGAIFVGGIQTVASGLLAPARRGAIRRIHHIDAQPLPAGAEMGRFNMGSTVILLLPPDTARWSDHLVADAQVRCRAEIGRLAPPP